ncbi:hypothetical protein O1611_g918 [Lasiodiplodia mahajangana]|uniref:Uncharacterized protein n=1 Tax=Lasiodiplodia mahajangana TaxID=1108764 RepID=A0ACC2JZC7_9PEZI|nr:hypothetical protein O1611_g918 [Lasiodiplodia mahajangana]
MSDTLMMKVRLVNVDISEVLADIEYRNSLYAHAGDLTTARFNTSFHTEREAPDIPTKPSEEPYSFKRWLPLILRSRGLVSSDAQVVTFSLAQARLLLQAADASIPSGSINRIYREEIDEEIVPAFKSIVFPPEGLFMRLEACSAKDGVQKIPGTSVLRSVDEVLLLLLTSSRARNAIFNALEGDSKVLELFFTPWNGRMRSEREYRVFCPPFRSADSLRISAISQYEWHKQWLFYLGSDERRKRIADKISKGCDEIRKQIAAELDPNDRMDALLMRQGLTFDVLFDEEHDLVQLVELNVFGVRSACGSCLFHWIRDRETLEGRGDPEDVEFRVTYQEINEDELSPSSPSEDDEGCEGEEG